jgi:hypothetical protein
LGDGCLRQIGRKKNREKRGKARKHTSIPRIFRVFLRFVHTICCTRGPVHIPVSLESRNVEHFMGIWTFGYISGIKRSGGHGISAAGALMFVEAALMYYPQNSRFMD